MKQLFGVWMKNTETYWQC